MKTVLYLGIEKPAYFDKDTRLIHYPIIKTIPRKKIECFEVFNQFLNFTHLIFTSKTAVNIFFKYLADFSFSQEEIKQKQYVVVGKATDQTLKKWGVENAMVAQNETAEGIIDLLKTLSLEKSFIFWPHSSLSRDTLMTFFLEQNLKFNECILYDTAPFLLKPFPDLTSVDEIVFTSPSTVDAFLILFPKLKLNIILTPIGPITKRKLEKCFT